MISGLILYFGFYGTRERFFAVNVELLLTVTVLESLQSRVDMARVCDSLYFISIHMCLYFHKLNLELHHLYLHLSMFKYL